MTAHLNKHYDTRRSTMSQVKDLENFMFELAKNEALEASQAEGYALELADCLEWDEDFSRSFVSNVQERVDRWRSFCEQDK